MPSARPAALLDATPDILVLGGGLAALVAALTAHEQNRRVAIASLGPVGRSGNTAVAENAISGVTNHPDNTVEAFVQDLLCSGKGVTDPALAASLAGHSHEALLLLKRYGVQFYHKDGDFARLPPVPGHTVARTIRADTSSMGHAFKGRAYLTPLTERAKEAGIPFLNGLRAVRLLQRDGHICGVMFHERKTGNIFIQPARRVILATGGYAGLFKNTSNVSDSYGDGISLALQAGCPVRDMEMVQFIPAILQGRLRMPISTQSLAFGAVLRNRDGERFMFRYDPSGDLAPRDAMARAIYSEIQAGRGVNDAIYLDCTPVPEDAYATSLASFAKRLQLCGIDPRRDTFLGAPGTHYSMGGVVVDRDGRTPIPGLYAAGEVIGGVHGANRIGGAALAEATVFGRLAALAASLDDVPTVSPEVTDIPSPACDEELAAVTTDLKQLRALLWERAGIVRDRTGLAQGLKSIANLLERWNASSHAPGQAFANTLRIAEAIIRSALLRTESRGAHYRSDHPEMDPAWNVSIHCSLRNGECILDRVAQK